jgi:transcriptional regulator with XRE-family HTH domain
MKIRTTSQTDAILRELGKRVRRRRLERDQAQADLATEAGIGEATLRRFEAGDSITLTNLIRVLRALGELGGLDSVLPEAIVSPIELARRSGKSRKRASRGPAREEDDRGAGGFTGDG